MVMNIQKVAQEIYEESLYNTILFEIKEKYQSMELSCETITTILQTDEALLQEYILINRYSELSSIHAKALSIGKNDSEQTIDAKNTINKNVQELKNLENFSVDSKGSAYEIWIGSVGIMLIFMIHNVVALFTELYATHSEVIYTLFGLIALATYYAYNKIKRNHELKFERYKTLYTNTNKLIHSACVNQYIKQEELY